MSNNTEPIKPVKNLIDFDLLTYYNTKLKTYLTTLLSKKQDTLDSTNIKTINGESILGSGDIKAGNPNANVEAVDTSDIIDDVISNENSNYELPIASLDTLGGVKVGTKIDSNKEQAVMNINETTGEIGINLCGGLSSHSKYGLGVKYGNGLNINNDGQLYVPAASYSTLGGVKIGSGLSIGSDGTINALLGGSNYQLPIASSSTLGGVKIGSGLMISNDGTINAIPMGSSYQLPVATRTTIGGVMIGSGLLLSSDGRIDAIPMGSSYQLPVASSSTLGGVKIGSGLLIGSDGRIDAIPMGSNYQLPIASSSTLGGVKIGSGLSIGSDGTLIASGVGSNLPKAYYETLGCVKIGTKTDTRGLQIDGFGQLGILCGVNSGVKINNGMLVVNYGTGLGIDTNGKLVATGEGGGSSYQLPIASDTTLGGVKIGTSSNARGLGIDDYGQLCINVGDGLSINNNNGKLYATSNKQIINTEEDNITLTNNNYYKKINTSSEITINLEHVENNIVTNYCIEFTTADTGTTITLPNTIKWINGNIPVFENGFTYQISIVNNLGIFAKYA